MSPNKLSEMQNDYISKPPHRSTVNLVGFATFWRVHVTMRYRELALCFCITERNREPIFATLTCDPSL